jgi:hypothetical protein
VWGGGGQVMGGVDIEGLWSTQGKGGCPRTVKSPGEARGET